MQPGRIVFIAALLAAPPLTARAQAPDTAHKVIQAGKAGATDTTRQAVRPVDSVAVHMIGDSLVASEAVALQAGPTWDIDVRSYETRERVTHFVSIFSGRAKERVTQWLERGSRYEPMIRARMRAGGLPEDMYYLALVESGFDANAYSRAAAVGMWQFMTSTARDMGLRVDWWVDERRDPVRSTNAAVRFIRGLRDQFGSLYLAAAAYNGGPGRVARGMARYADDVSADDQDPFFVLADKDYLRNETRDYVPQLIAAALIAKAPARYGMDVHPQPAFAYDSVTVPASTPLSAVARAAGTDMGTVLELNPQFLRGMTPPRDSSSVRVPPGAGATFDSAFALLAPGERVATRRVETVKGDSPDKVGRAHGVSAAAVRAFNPGVHVLKSGRYSAGQSLVVPTADVAAAMRNVPDPSIERYTRKSKRPRARAGKARAGKAHASSKGKAKTPTARSHSGGQKAKQKTTKKKKASQG